MNNYIVNVMHEGVIFSTMVAFASNPMEAIESTVMRGGLATPPASQFDVIVDTQAGMAFKITIIRTE